MGAVVIDLCADDRAAASARRHVEISCWMGAMLKDSADLATSNEAAAFTISHRAGKGPRPLDCWIALPEQPRPGARALVAVHGIARGAKAQAEAFAARAAALGRPVIAPLFDERRWQGYQRTVAPRRADLALLGLMQDLAVEGVIEHRAFDLFGFSGGAQFAHRFAMLYPNRLRRLSVCAAGWWTMPEAAPFPYGLQGAWGAKLEAGLARFLRLEIAVSVGALDNLPDPNTRSTAALDVRQGRDRVSRAEAWTDALIATAARLGVDGPRPTLTVLPGCGHDFEQCAADGALARLTLPST